MSIHIRFLLGLSALALMTSFGGMAKAEEGPGAQVTPGSPVSIFGNKGQIAISSEAGATLTHTTLSGADGSTTSFVLRPGVDYFMIKSLSLGVFLGVEHQSARGGSSTAFGVGPRVGYDVAFSNHLSLWPKLGFSYNTITQKVDAEDIGGIQTPAVSDTNKAIAFNLFVPLLYHTNHYFAGVGPALDTDLSGDPKATTFAVRVTLGGWIF